MDTSQSEQRAILTICLNAAFADGAKDDREREQIRRIAENLAPGNTIDLSALYQDVLLNQSQIEQSAAEIGSRELRQYAYEMAVGVCAADGAKTNAENEFLERLRVALGLEVASTVVATRQADDIASAPLPVSSTTPAAELDQMILNFSIVNGALELLPQSLASMAILPLQMRMVYRIGKAYGYELDRGHIKDFAATLGIGFTGQYVEQMGRKLIGGLLGRFGGGLLQGLGGVATGSAFSFATTYALGQVAMKYYAGGRTIDMNQLRQVFESLFERGKSLQSMHSGDILQKAQTIDLNQISGLVRGL